MSTSLRLMALVLACCGAAAYATDLTISLTCDPSTTPGGSAQFTMTGTLSSSSDNEGLALFGVTMSASGPATINLGADATVNAGGSMGNFVSPDGLNNPTDCTGCFGFGGTAIGNDLVQIGGGMNTIGNTVDNAPFPIGSVDLGIAFPPGGTVLATGTITMPATLGDYNISLSDGFANVIRDGEVGPTVFATESANVLTSGCTIAVQNNAPDANIIAAQSLRTHNVTELGVNLITSNGIDARQGGPRKLAFTVDQDMDGTTVNAGNVQLLCATGPVPVVSSATLSVDLRVVTVNLATGIANNDCCELSFNGMETTGGGAVASTFAVTSEYGDLNYDRAVTGGDALLVKTHFGEVAGVNLSDPKWDFDVNGSVTGADYSLIKPLFGNIAAACP